MTKSEYPAGNSQNRPVRFSCNEIFDAVFGFHCCEEMDFLYLLSLLFTQLGWFDNRLFWHLFFFKEPVRSFPPFVSKLSYFAVSCRHIRGVVLGWAIQPFHFHFLALLVYLSNAVSGELFPRQTEDWLSISMQFESQSSTVNAMSHANVHVICNKLKTGHCHSPFCNSRPTCKNSTSLFRRLGLITAIPVVAETICKSMYFIGCRTLVILLGIHLIPVISETLLLCHKGKALHQRAAV